MTVIDEQVFVHGKVFIARNEAEFVSAFKMSEGKISWMGDANEVDGAGAIYLQGKTVLPSFIDVHTHPTYVAMTLGAVAGLASGRRGRRPLSSGGCRRRTATHLASASPCAD